MKKIVISGTDLRVSRFSFGTASLHHLGSMKKQVRLLEAAAEAGFSHFDTAPLYGFGETERTLGRVFHSANDLSVATKVGLYPPGGREQPRSIVLARKVFGRWSPSLSKAVVDLSISSARASLDRSLSSLRRERVDLLLLHEPDPALFNTDECLRWLESESDRVRFFGVSGPSHVVAPFVVEENPIAKVVQASDSLARNEASFMARANRQQQFTYGYMSSSIGELSPSVITVESLKQNQSGSIIVSTRLTSRLNQFSAAVAGEEL